MKTLNQLFPQLSISVSIHDIHNDSRLVDQHSLFIAYTGFEINLHSFIPAAYENGCRYFLVDNSVFTKLSQQFPDAIFIPTDNLKQDSAKIIWEFYNHPDKNLCVIGVTGTNGKTTTATLINQSLKALGNKTTFFGTVEWWVGDKSYPASNTTPDLLQFVKFLQQSVQEGVSHVVMEIASHALSLGRVEYLNIDYALFTNLTQDHLDFHGNFEEYFSAKSSLFLNLLANSSKIPKKAIINADDEYGQQLLQQLGGRGIPSESLSINEIGSWNATQIHLTVNHTDFVLQSSTESIKINSSLLGLINVQNLMMAIVLLKELAYSNEQILSVINQISIPGRLQKINAPNGAVFLVDYAHTPDALEKAIDVVKAVLSPEKKAIVVFGAGGDRDRTKRPLMAKATSQADVVIITSDNPRTEDPIQILDDIATGFDSNTTFFQEVDRKKALSLAYQHSQSGDVILVAGKGHENYQIIGKIKHDFSDIEEIERLFEGEL